MDPALKPAPTRLSADPKTLPSAEGLHMWVLGFLLTHAAFGKVNTATGTWDVNVGLLATPRILYLSPFSASLGNLVITNLYVSIWCTICSYVWNIIYKFITYIMYKLLIKYFGFLSGSPISQSGERAQVAPKPGNGGQDIGLNASCGRGS